MVDSPIIALPPIPPKKPETTLPTAIAATTMPEWCVDLVKEETTSAVIRLSIEPTAHNSTPCRKMVGRLAMFSFDNPYSSFRKKGTCAWGEKRQSRACKQRFRHTQRARPRPFTGKASADVNSLMSPIVSVR